MSEKHFPAVNLLAAQMEARQRVRIQWQKSAGYLIDAHELAFSAVSSMINRFSGRHFAKQPKAIEGRMSLSAQFVQGVDICETAISEGLYSQAAALLKQELETLAAIDEFENDRRRDGRTPNLSDGIVSGFGPIYGDLNNIAHVSRHDLAVQLVTVQKGAICGPTLIPQFNEGLARSLYGNHVYFIVEITRQVERIFKEVFGEGISNDESKWAGLAMMILLKEKVIELPPEAKARYPDLDFQK
jgi:hypothetical protein